jgi:dihydroorotate dehydrogenase
MADRSTLYTRVLRPLLFRLDPETAHHLALRALSVDLPWRVIGRLGAVRDPRLQVELAGLRLPNPVGLAPGLDKNGRAVRALAALGFGYIVVGSITRLPRAGNPRPRLLRDPANEAVINSLGLPGIGLDRAIEGLRRLDGVGVPLIASVAGFSPEELAESAAALEPFVDAVEIGLVCPNSTETERMQELEMYETLVRQLVARRRKPVFIKLPPHRDPASAASVQQMVRLGADLGIDGLSVSGSRPIVTPRLATGRGSIAGRPVLPDTVRILADVAGWAAGRLPIRAGGGVFTGANTLELLRAGAAAVEVYSAFIYRGPAVAREISRELLARLDAEGLTALPGRTAVPAVG